MHKWDASSYSYVPTQVDDEDGDQDADVVLTQPTTSSAPQHDVLSPFQQINGMGQAPPLPRAVVDGARQASLPLGVEGWSQRADEAEALAHRLLDALRPSDSEVCVDGGSVGPDPGHWRTHSFVRRLVWRAQHP